MLSSHLFFCLPLLLAPFTVPYRIAKHDLDALEADTTAILKFVAASFSCKDLKKSIIVGCMYRPTNNNIDYTQDLYSAVSDLSARFKDHIIWLGGAANLPDIDWKTDTIIGHRTVPSLNKSGIYRHLQR